MNQKQKNITFFSLVFIFIVVILALLITYFPLRKIIRITDMDEPGLTGRGKMQPSAPHTLFFDFEIDPATGTPSGLYRNIAHSGEFSAKAFGKNSYSYTIERTAGEIGIDNLKAVALSCWVYIFPARNEPLGAMVFAMTSSLGVNICWKGVNLGGPGMPRGKWFKISGFFDLSGIDMKPDNKIQVYFWNNSSTDILVDDYYIVFGAPEERKGDSARVDLTKGIFRPEFNFPPFPVYCFEREEIRNLNSVYLVNSGNVKQGEILPSDKVLTGRFLDQSNGTEDILVLKNSGIAELFSWCSKRGEFRKISISGLPGISSSPDFPVILSGQFSGEAADQLLFIDSQKISLGSFDKVQDPCSHENDPGTSFRIIATADLASLGLHRDIKSIAYLAADFNGDNKSEILVLPGDGSWKIFRYEPAVASVGKWTSVEGMEGSRNSIWDSRNNPFRAFTAKFLPGFNGDMVLTVFKDRSKGKISYSLRRYDGEKQKFIPWFSEKQDYTGISIGLDTLKMEDQFFTGNFKSISRQEILRYNRDWRFDLKEIGFNDTTFRILANIDFHGYEQDQNPKYYEFLRIISGKFIDPGINSLLIIARNNKELPYLPNTLQVYSLKKQGK